MAGTYRALDELRRNGEIKAIGMGVNDAKPIADALDLGQWDCFLLAGRYTLLEQEPLKTLLPAIAKHGASVVVGGPFNSGVLAGRDTWNYTRAPEAGDDAGQGPCAGLRRSPCASRGGRAPFPPRPSNGRERDPGAALDGGAQPDLRMVEPKIPASLWSDLKNEKLIEADAPVPS